MDKKRFFSAFDKAAFWTATLATFAVYFFTLGPSVGVEDSGELATAAAHLGVPHPPGYPFWTFCSWIFCKIFSFVTYMGHPTPAWAVSCCSSVFGAFAAGCTAMLICRSARDMVGDVAFSGGATLRDDWLCFAGGVGGAIAFALSPVEWSQSTIVEIYSLNALFLMWVFLLSYRWMKKPSDKTLWLTAFVFGLGLTNYQVLLFAIVPLAIIIAMKNFAMFMDFLLYLMPAALVYQILQIGDMQRATENMTANVIAKHPGVAAAQCPSGIAVAASVALLVAAAVLAVRFRKRKPFEYAELVPPGVALAAAAVLGLAMLFPSEISWASEALRPDWQYARRVGLPYFGQWPAEPLQIATDMPSVTAPLVDPRIYAGVALCIMLSVAASILAAMKRDEESSAWRIAPLVFSAIFAVIAVEIVVTCVPRADWAGYEGVRYDWSQSRFWCHAVIAAFLACSLFRKGGLAFSIPVAGFHIAAFMLLERGAMNGLVHPSCWWFWWPIAWNFIVLTLAWLVLPHGRTVAFAALFAQLGVSFYAYMPVVSDLRNPPMNWGFPRTWDGFKHAITRGQYEAITLPGFKSFGGFWSFIKGQMGHYFADVKMQFSDFIVFFALLPFACWRLVLPAGGGRRTTVRCLWLVLGALALLLVRSLASLAGASGGGFWEGFDRFLIAYMGLLCVVGVVAIFFRQIVFGPAAALRRFVCGAAGRRDWMSIAGMSVLSVVLLSVLFKLAAPFKGVTWLLVFSGAFFAIAVFASVSAFAPKIVRGMSWMSSRGVSLSFESKSVWQQWLFASGVCFFVMTVPLIALAQVKGDLQDGFIQKVKFISSHAMIALWIGYGLAFAGVFTVRLADRWAPLAARKRLFAAIVCAVAVLGATIAPIVQNYTDDDLVRRLGGSEQNGHTFGWQFGAYQLEGAKAIRAQLSADEEPLPDPSWPPPMDPYAIFFGGTDPGRFVPTYMIYSAGFRPDVYLITQNALADDTYMAVERDLYGDEIWIPAKEDCQTAFSVYKSEVDRGIREPNGEIKEENGRIQVTGALGVMELNSILSQMMFEHDRDRHSFYLEESYAIKWMYDYLSPHGLIMKINRDKTGYDRKTAALDRDFWDWYSKRLMDDPMYRRDFAAQKSFSKLRSSIAGLYRIQGRAGDASQAFREANLLYPASPESVFKYATEILMPFGKLGIVRELMDYTDSIDPNNKRTGRIREYVENTETARRLEIKLARDGTLPVAEAFELSCAYAFIGNLRQSGRIMSQVYDKLAARSDVEQAIDILLSSGYSSDAEKLLKRYLASYKNPEVRYMAKMAVLQHAKGNAPYAYALIDKAASKSRNETADVLRQYVDLLSVEKRDCMLLLKLSKMELKLGRRDRGYGYFIEACNVSAEACQMELSRDREYKRLLEPLLSRITRR